MAWHNINEPGVDSLIATDAHAKVYALAAGSTLKLIDLRHALVSAQPPAGSTVPPSFCAFLDDDTLEVASSEHLLVARPDGMTTVRALPSSCDLRMLLACSGPDLVLAENLASHLPAAVWNVLNGTMVRRLESVAGDGFFEFSPQCTSLCYSKDSRTIVVVDLLHPDRTPLVVGESDDRRGESVAAWDGHGQMLCLSRSFNTAEGLLEEAHASAWDLTQGRQLWVPHDVHGELPRVCNLVPSNDGSLAVAVETLPEELHRLPPPMRQRREGFDNYRAFLLDGGTGQVLRPLDSPGRDAAFTSDQTRIVNQRAVVRVQDGHVIEVLQPTWSPALSICFSPTHTWVATCHDRVWDGVIDVAGAGLRLPFPMQALRDSSWGLLPVIWNAAEDRMAIQNLQGERVLAIDLYPTVAPTRDCQATLLKLEDPQQWLVAACALGGAGEPAVACLRRGPMTAHRIIALERCVRSGTQSALGVLAQARLLPEPLGYLADDAYARASQGLAARQRALAHGDLKP